VPAAKEKTPKGTPRNIDATKARFLSAVDSLLRKDGLQSLGVNAIADRAGRDKALLYKYFGDLDGLYAAFAETAGLFPTLEEMLGPALAQAAAMPPLDLSKAFVSGYLREIRKRPLTLEILRWELVVRNPLTKALSDYRSKQTLAFNALLKAPAGLDLAALTSILYGGMVYLLLKAGSPGRFNGLDLKDEASWSRVEAGLHTLLEALFKAARP
jgi:AcrR family transcriptional regulator